MLGRTVRAWRDVQKIDHPWLPATAPRTVTTLSASSTQCARCSQAKATAGPRRRPAAEMAVQDEAARPRTGRAANSSHRQTMACIHQKLAVAEPIPKIEPPGHVEAGQSHHDDRGPRLPGEAVLDRLECRKPVLRPDRRAARPAARRWSPSTRRRSRSPRQDMQCAGRGRRHPRLFLAPAGPKYPASGLAYRRTHRLDLPP